MVYQQIRSIFWSEGGGEGLSKLLLSIFLLSTLLFFLIRSCFLRALNNCFSLSESEASSSDTWHLTTSQPSYSLFGIRINFCYFKSNFLPSCNIFRHFFALPFFVELIVWLIFSSILGFSNFLTFYCFIRRFVSEFLRFVVCRCVPCGARTEREVIANWNTPIFSDAWRVSCHYCVNGRKTISNSLWVVGNLIPHW